MSELSTQYLLESDGPIDVAFRLLKRQTTLPMYDPALSEETGYSGVPPVQQWSAQPLSFMDEYTRGEYPEHLWTSVSPDVESTRSFGRSRHRGGPEGDYLAVGVRGQGPIGDLPTRGPFRPRKGRAGFPQDYGVRVIPRGQMPEQEQLVMQPMSFSEDSTNKAASPQKKIYDTKYESSPARVKYREELNQERRKRGIYGHGGPDMSHTKEGTLVAEDPHTNRARHFKERGTLKG